MATIEGMFPKVGGDPLYFSEANRFADCERLIYIGGSTWALSGTLPGICGSVLISPGSGGIIGKVALLNINYRTFTNAGSAAPVFYMSGTQQGIGSLNITKLANVDIMHGTVTAFLGSPYSGGIFAVAFQKDGTLGGNPNPGFIGISNWDTGSPFVIFNRVDYGGNTGGSAGFLNFTVKIASRF